MTTLTEAQARVLREIDHFPTDEIRQERYALLAAGLCDIHSSEWELTPAGREALAAYEEKQNALD